MRENEVGRPFVLSFCDKISTIKCITLSNKERIMKRYLYVLLAIALFALQACATDAAPVEQDEAAMSIIQPNCL